MKGLPGQENGENGDQPKVKSLQELMQGLPPPSQKAPPKVKSLQELMQETAPQAPSAAEPSQP